MPKKNPIKIIVVRHAVAMDREIFSVEGKPDGQRPLTQKGKREFKKFLKKTKHHLKDAEMILTSPYLRASQTAELLRKEFKSLKFLETSDLKAESNPQKLITSLKKMKSNSVILVGHEPFLSTFVSLLLAGTKRQIIEIKKGGIVVLSVKDLQSLGVGKAVLLWSMNPSII